MMASAFQSLIHSCKTCKRAPMFRDGMCRQCFKKFADHEGLWELDKEMEVWYGER